MAEKTERNWIILILVIALFMHLYASHDAALSVSPPWEKQL